MFLWRQVRWIRDAAMVRQTQRRQKKLIHRNPQGNPDIPVQHNNRQNLSQINVVLKNNVLKFKLVKQNMTRAAKFLDEYIVARRF